ncbi:MAG: MFS transporter [Planctomycetota bacterium]
MNSLPPEGRNLRKLALVQAIFRVGWIFKTESIIIPAALDSIAGAAWIRGCLPLLSRLGISLTPALLGKVIRNAALKRRALAICVLCMAVCMALLASLWTGFVPDRFVVPSFLLLYGTFFALHGLNQVAFGTLQGKVIAAEQRGCLMMLANVSSSVLAVTLVLLLLPRWLQSPTPRFELIFLMPALWFTASALLAHRIEELPDHHEERFTTGDFVRSIADLVRSSVPLRRALLVAFLTGFALVLFPHYQALARERLGLPATSLTVFVAVQSVGAALASVVAGFNADRFGNRIVLLCILAGLAATPVAAIVLAGSPRLGPTLYPGVFMCIGLTPVMFRIFQNYVIEVIDEAYHPQALSAMTLSLALPVLSSPGVGVFIDRFGFAAAFLAVASLLCLAWLCALRLPEPRMLATKSREP